MDEATMLAAAVQERAGLRYPKELRDRLTRYARRERVRGASWTKIAEDLGVAGQTLQRWLEGSTADSTGFVAVRSVRSNGTQGVALVSPTGWRVEGLGPIPSKPVELTFDEAARGQSDAAQVSPLGVGEVGREPASSSTVVVASMPAPESSEAVPRRPKGSALG